MFGLSFVDVSLYFLFFIFFISISLYISHAREVTVESYFFANRNINWALLGISFIATSLMSPYLFALSSFEEASGLILIYAVCSVVMLLILGLFIAPLYHKAGISTLPEYFEKRFNRDFRLILSGLYIFWNIFVRLVVVLSLGNIFINSITHSDAYSSILFFLLITGIYVIIWGLQAEIYMNLVQFLIVAVGVLGFIVWMIYQNDTLSFTADKLFASAGTGNGITWPGAALGLPVIAFWFWCADQLMVQKVLSVKKISSVKKAAWVSALLQIVPLLIFTLPGIVFISSFQGMTADEAVHTLITGDIIPESMRGILIVIISAALMATFANLFNSTSILFTFDFYRTFKPESPDRKLVFTGRLATMVLLLSAILLIPISQLMSLELTLNLFKSLAWFASMITAVFLGSLISRKITSGGAILTISAGTILIIYRTISEIISGKTSDATGLTRWLTGSGFAEFSALIFLFCFFFLFAFILAESFQHSLMHFLRVLKSNLLKIKL